ncbi:MAG: hypothetical protein RDU25_01760 [Patescibacteria group bacterium]|nr:hypothetical protein [Patescibacteria group bacterium]
MSYRRTFVIFCTVALVALSGCAKNYTAQAYTSPDEPATVSIFPGPIKSDDLKYTASLRLPLGMQPTGASVSCTDGYGHLVRFRVIDSSHVMLSVSGESDRLISVDTGYMLKWRGEYPLRHCGVDKDSPPGTLAFFTFGEYALVVNKWGRECEEVSYERGCRKYPRLARDLCYYPDRSSISELVATYDMPHEIASLIATK